MYYDEMQVWVGVVGVEVVEEMKEDATKRKK
jgi:hypothetical protein